MTHHHSQVKYYLKAEVEWHAAEEALDQEAHAKNSQTIFQLEVEQEQDFSSLSEVVINYWNQIGVLKHKTNFGYNRNSKLNDHLTNAEQLSAQLQARSSNDLVKAQGMSITRFSGKKPLGNSNFPQGIEKNGSRALLEGQASIPFKKVDQLGMGLEDNYVTADEVLLPKIEGSFHSRAGV